MFDVKSTVVAYRGKTKNIVSVNSKIKNLPYHDEKVVREAIEQNKVNASVCK